MSKFLSLLILPAVVLICCLPGNSAVVFPGAFSVAPPCVGGNVCNFAPAHVDVGIGVRTPFNVQLDWSSNLLAQLPPPNVTFSPGILATTNGEILATSFPYVAGTRYLTFFALSVFAADAATGLPLPVSTGLLPLAYFHTPNYAPALRDRRNADILYNPRHPEWGGVYILEGNTLIESTLRVGLTAVFSSIEFTGFEALPGEVNGFLAPLPPGVTDANGDFILNAFVPEPGSAVTVVIGISMLGVLSYWRKRVRPLP